MGRRGWILLLLGWSCLARAATMQEIDARQTVVIANANVPASIELARYYLERRGIPTNHLCVLDLPVGETMSRWFYENKLRGPLLHFLREGSLIEQVRRETPDDEAPAGAWRTLRHSIRYVVCMYGVPLRIAETRPFFLQKLARLVDEPMQRDGAAVDSELSLALWDTYDLRGIVPNPMYNLTAWLRNERQVRPVLIAARLDGPTPDIVRNMIDGALEAERIGLHGRVYIDQRPLRDADYAIGEFWLREAAERFRRQGYEVLVDRHDAVFSDSYPMESPAVYLGWYAEQVSGPFRRTSFRFRPGAVAYHLHSTSGETLRSEESFWAGPMLARGAAAVMASIDEPYLIYTPDLQVFADRLVTGYSFGESAYLAQRTLSWQITVAGDPLYRPFAVGLDERIRQLEEAKQPEVVWEYIRRLNLLLDAHQFTMVLRLGREGVAQNGSPLLREKVAELMAKNEIWEEALRDFRKVIDEAQDDVTAVRVGHRLLWLLRRMQQTQAADELEARIVARWPESPYLPYLKEGMP